MRLAGCGPPAPTSLGAAWRRASGAAGSEREARESRLGDPESTTVRAAAGSTSGGGYTGATGRGAGRRAATEA
jgi:hypothetical protein